MNLKKFDIALVNFPFSDLTKTKKRPALVIKPLEGRNVIFCQITTKRRNIQKYEVPIRKEDCFGNIRFDSFAYLDMIFTLHQSIIYGKVGEIKNSKVKDLINQKIKLIL